MWQAEALQSPIVRAALCYIAQLRRAGAGLGSPCASSRHPSFYVPGMMFCCRDFQRQLLSMADAMLPEIYALPRDRVV